MFRTASYRGRHEFASGLEQARFVIACLRNGFTTSQGVRSAGAAHRRKIRVFAGNARDRGAPHPNSAAYFAKRSRRHICKCCPVPARLDTLGYAAPFRSGNSKMRLTILSLAVVVAMLGETQGTLAQSSYSYPWCSVDPRFPGRRSCYYNSREECLRTMSGIGGVCIQSPYYHAGEAPLRNRRRAAKSRK